MSQTKPQTATVADDRNRLPRLETLDSPNSKLVYLYLETAGESTATEICEQLDIDHLTAFSLLDTLVGEGMVAKRDGAYTTTN